MLILATLIALLQGSPATSSQGGGSQASCRDSKILFDTGTLERIVRDPEAVLGDQQAFWQNEKPQQYTRMWAEGVKREIDYGAWRDALRAWAALDPAARDSAPLLRMTRTIVSKRSQFLGDAVPFVCSFLPAGVNLEIEVYFSAFLPARSFLKQGIVINVAATYWQGDADNILNNLVHEIFHVGYARRRELWTETPLADSRTYDMLDALQNEGMGTYVGWRAVDQFPAPDERDYRLLESPSHVARLRDDLNGLLARVGAVPAEELDRLSWDLGVMGRAYYVVGAHMARTIEAQQGRDGLIRTVVEGPLSFTTRYNELVWTAPNRATMWSQSRVTPHRDFSRPSQSRARRASAKGAQDADGEALKADRRSSAEGTSPPGTGS